MDGQKEKEVFFKLTTFFQEQKDFVKGTSFVQFFMYCKTKKNLEFFFSKIVK